MIPMLPLARPRAALRMIALSLVMVAIIGFATRRYLFPAASAELTVFLIWWIAAFIAIAGLANAVVQAVDLRHESDLLETLRTANFTDELDRIDKTMPGRQSLMVYEQAAALRSVLASGTASHGEFKSDQRRIAIERTASVGAAQRFLASTLLLLAVLGTFAGLKSALPHLSNALTNEVRRGQSDIVASTPAPVSGSDGTMAETADGSGSAVTTALDLVSNAFGANFVALLGSLVLGAAGFGLSRDRRTLLMNLDDVATRVWYVLLPVNTGVSALERAVEQMRGSAVEVGRVGDAIGGLNGRLETFQNTLVDALQTMVGDVRSSVQANAIAADRRTDSQLTEVAHNLGLITKALERTAVGYEGLVKGLQERDLGVTAAAQALEKSVLHAVSTETLLSTAAREIVSSRKEWEDRDVEVRGEISELLLTLQVSTKGVEEAASRQAASLAITAEMLEALRTDQTVGLGLAARSAADQLRAVNENGERLDRLVEGVALLHSVEFALRGEIAEVQATIRRLSEQAVANADRLYRVTLATHTTLDSKLGELRDGVSVGLMRVVRAGERQCESIDAVGATQLAVLESLRATLEGGHAERMQAVAGLQTELRNIQSALPTYAAHTLQDMIDSGSRTSNGDTATASHATAGE